MSHPNLNEPWIATKSWEKNCGTTPRSDFTMARRLCGTAEVRSLQTLEHWRERPVPSLLQRIPDIKDLQCVWLVLLYCAGARANFYGRTVSPSLSHAFATQHDTQIWSCFGTLVGVDPGGIARAVKLRHAARWASWADAIQMIAERHPEIAGTIIRTVHKEHEAPIVQDIVISQRSVEADGFVCPSWEDLATGEVSASPEEDEPKPTQGGLGVPSSPQS